MKKVLTSKVSIMKKQTCYSFLSMLYLTFMTASLLLSYRFINIAGILTVGSVFVIPLTYAISDIISELYGYAAMRATIWKMLICLFILFSSIFLIIKLPANIKYQSFTEHYDFMFQPMMRVYFANLTGILLGMFLNSYLLVKWKMKLNGRLFYLRSIVSSALGEIIFTSITIMLVQLGVSSTHAIIEMIAVSVSVKIFFTLFSSLIATVIKKRLIKIDGGDCFEAVNDYNPFKTKTALLS